MKHALSGRRSKPTRFKPFTRIAILAHLTSLLILVLAGCIPVAQSSSDVGLPESIDPVPATPLEPLPTSLPTRPPYLPGTPVDYTAQMGDTLPALAARFNTTIAEIRQANPIIPDGATTMPPGMPMSIPIYYEPLWGSPYQILPDSLFINGPAQRDFDPVTYVNSQPGWFKNYSFYLGERDRRGGEVVQYIATNFSISPRLLLALLEYQAGALTNPDPPADVNLYPLGYRSTLNQGPARQLLWAANQLNDAYYRWRAGTLDSFDHQDRRTERPDPWQNAATVALHVYFARVLPREAFEYAVSGSGFKQTYQDLFGDPWQNLEPHIPGSLTQPEMWLPFGGGRLWAYTGGPHTAWGDGEPLAALDFAPPSVVGGCRPSDEPATAVASGVIARTGDASLVLDLDGDGDERTGWVVFYLHLANSSLPPVGKVLQAGDPIGLPSCEGGRSTGTHVHIARKFNGEWILADGPLAFNLEGWVSANGNAPYQGTLKQMGRTVQACDCSDAASHVRAAIR